MTPFGFMANGVSTLTSGRWEKLTPRLVAGFFGPDDLHRLLFLRQNQLAAGNDAHQPGHR